MLKDDFIYNYKYYNVYFKHILYSRFTLLVWLFVFIFSCLWW